MSTKFVKHGISRYQRIASIAVMVYAISLPTLIGSCIVMRRSNPSWASLAAALAAAETGLMMAAAVVRGVMTGRLDYGYPFRGILVERLEERPVGFRLVLIVLALVKP